MANLNFRYTHENPYNEDMERVLQNNGYEEYMDDDEGIEYRKIEDNTFMDVANPDVVYFDFRPCSVYGWGFKDEVLVLLLDQNKEEIGEINIDVNDFIDMYN